MHRRRNRLTYFLLIVATIGIGLLSRASFIPELLLPYLGDVLYTTMYFFIFGFLFPEMPPMKVLLLSIGVCYVIEFLQFYKADWIMAIRRTRLGGLILGFGFLWSDLLCYTIGGFLGFGIEKYAGLYTEAPDL